MDFLTAVAAEAGEAFISEFSEVVDYLPAGGTAVGISGIFDRISDVADIGALVQADGVAATLTATTASLPAVALGDMVTARGDSYRVVGIEPDGTGHTMLVLGI